jgi:hypothetical protein
MREAQNPIARHVRERGWVWGSWVCPVVSLWFPFQIVRDVQAATNPHGRWTALIGWWWAAFLVLNLMWSAYSLRGGDGYDLAEVKAFNAIAGIGEVIGLLLSLAAGTLWAAIVLRIGRNQAACWLAVKRPVIFPPVPSLVCVPVRVRAACVLVLLTRTRKFWALGRSERDSRLKGPLL